MTIPTLAMSVLEGLANGGDHQRRRPRARVHVTDRPRAQERGAALDRLHRYGGEGGIRCSPADAGEEPATTAGELALRRGDDVEQRLLADVGLADPLHRLDGNAERARQI